MDAEVLYMLAQEAQEIGVPYIVLTKTTSQSLTGSSTNAIAWSSSTDVQYTDSTGAGFSSASVGSSAIKMPVGGLYSINGNITLSGVLTNGSLLVGVGIGSTAPATTFAYRGSDSTYASITGSLSGGISIVIPITAGTFVSLLASPSSTYSTDGNPKNTWLSIAYQGPI
jgi:hypothetical protein